MGRRPVSHEVSAGSEPAQCLFGHGSQLSRVRRFAGSKRQGFAGNRRRLAGILAANRRGAWMPAQAPIRSLFTAYPTLTSGKRQGCLQWNPKKTLIFRGARLGANQPARAALDGRFPPVSVDRPGARAGLTGKRGRTGPVGAKKATWQTETAMPPTARPPMTSRGTNGCQRRFPRYVYAELRCRAVVRIPVARGAGFQHLS